MRPPTTATGALTTINATPKGVSLAVSTVHRVAPTSRRKCWTKKSPVSLIKHASDAGSHPQTVTFARSTANVIQYMVLGIPKVVKLVLNVILTIDVYAKNLRRMQR